MTQSKLTLNQPTASSNANTPVVARFQSEAPAGVVFMGGFYAGGMKKARSVAASFWSVELT